MPWTKEARKSVYHTRQDMVENVEPQAVAQAAAVALTFALAIEEGSYR
jgi:hypothetical protein